MADRQKHPGPGRGRGPGGGPHALMPGEKAKNFKGAMKRLLTYMGKYKLTVALVTVIAIASTAFMIVGPKILGQATTELFRGVMASMEGSGSIDMAAVGSILVTALTLYIASSLLSYLMGFLMSHVSTDLSYRFRKDIADKLNAVPLSYIDKQSHGDILSRITNDVDTINQTLSQSLTQMITSVVTVLGVMVMMLSISWQLTLAALLILPMSTVVIMFLVKKSQKHFKAQQEYLGKVNGHVEEMFTGHTVMKAFRGEKKSIETFDSFNKPLHDAGWKSQFLSGLMMPVMMIFGNLGFVAIAIIGGFMAGTGALAIGDIQAFIQYVRNFTQPLTQMANISNVLQRTMAATERVFEFLDEDQEVEDVTDSKYPGPLSGQVSFDNVHFGYDPEVPVIKNFSAQAKPGQKIAIVGPTGAGKTTMVKLLMRFYDVQEGSITVDGVDIRQMKREELRRNFAMVLQDSWLYNASVLENIRYGRPDASDAEVEAAAQAAHVDHFVHTWPGGYAMEINEETSNISQGQKQLLTIARAILADPRILILDEATSSVDTRTEVLIQKAMDRLMEGRTSFIIAHRLSTIRNADLILVMKDGDIIEQGNHQELMDRSGFYADLYNSQFDLV